MQTKVTFSDFSGSPFTVLPVGDDSYRFIFTIPAAQGGGFSSVQVDKKKLHTALLGIETNAACAPVSDSED